MVTNRRKLLPQVRRTVRELGLGPEDAGVVRLAEVLAATIDEMAPDTRERMLGQTASQLARVLTMLDERGQRRRATARGHSPKAAALDELRARHVLRAAR